VCLCISTIAPLAHPHAGTSSTAQLAEVIFCGAEAADPVSPIRSRQPVRRTATVADLSLKGSSSKQQNTGGGLLVDNRAGGQGQLNGCAPAASAKQSVAVSLLHGKTSKDTVQGSADSSSSPAYSRQPSALGGIFGKLTPDGSTSSKHPALGLFGKGSGSSERPAVLPRTPSLSMRMEGEAVGKEGLSGKLKRIVRRSKSKSGVPAHSPVSCWDQGWTWVTRFHARVCSVLVPYDNLRLPAVPG